MNKLAILGASGHGKVAADIALQCGWKEVSFFDDNAEGKNKVEHWPLLGDTHALLDSASRFSGIFVAIGNNKIRHEKLTLLSTGGTPIVTLVHPRAIVSPYATLAEGVMIVGGAVVNAFCKVGFGGIVNTGATVGHDCNLDQCVHVAPGANVAGNVSIGRLSWVGAGSAIKQGIIIGAGVTIGVGAAVIRNAKDGEILMGVPAKPYSGKSSD